MSKSNISKPALWLLPGVVSLAGCWVHAEPNPPRHVERHEVVVHAEDGDGHHDHDDEHHHHHHDEHHD